VVLQVSPQGHFFYTGLIQQFSIWQRKGGASSRKEKDGYDEEQVKDSGNDWQEQGFREMLN